MFTIPASLICVISPPTTGLIKATVFVAVGAACLIYLQVSIFAKGNYRNMEFPEVTLHMLRREHGSDADDVTDEAKIAYQLERRHLAKKAFWNLGSHQKDFMFFVANYHPILGIFNHHSSHPISLLTRLLIEGNALGNAISIQLEVDLCTLGFQPEYNPIVKSLVSIVIPMVTAEVLYQYAVCPCMAQSAKEKVTGCAGCCKFKCAPGYRVILAISMIAQFYGLAQATPALFLLGLGARFFGYLLFFPQAYIMQILPFMGAWTKDNAKENASLTESLTKEEKAVGLRGETCGQAVLRVIACTFVLVVAIVVKHFAATGLTGCNCDAP